MPDLRPRQLEAAQPSSRSATRCLQGCRLHAMQLVLLLLAALSCASSAQRPPVGSTVVHLRQGSQPTLLEALRNSSVGRIVLDGNYSVEREVPSISSVPFNLTRNVTIEGALSAGPRPTTLDLAFRRSVVLLCATCRVTLRDLTLANARRGTGPALDFFVGDDNHERTAVLLERVHRLRLACTSGSDVTDVLANTPRSKVLPGPTSPQRFTVKNVTLEGVSYPEALHMLDFTQHLELTHQEGRGHAASAHFGGYSLGVRDVLYLCQHVVSEECLAEKSPEACVNELIDKLVSGKKQGGEGGLSGAIVAAIVVPIVLVGASAVAFAMWALRRRRQRRQQQQQLLPSHSLKPGASGGSLAFKMPSGSVDLTDDVIGVDSAMEVYTKSNRARSGGRRSLEAAMQPKGGAMGWQLVSSSVAASVDPRPREEELSQVVFGPFLGAGSYGRVYRARWANREVACKVIEHDKATLAVVEAEAGLMLSLAHVNVVRAFAFCTFLAPEQARSEHSSSSKGGRRRSFGSKRQGSSTGGSPGQLERGQSGAASSSPGGSNSSISGASAAHSHSGSAGGRAALQQQRQQLAAGQLQQQPSPSSAHDPLVTRLSRGADSASEAQLVEAAAGAASATPLAAAAAAADAPNSRDARRAVSFAVDETERSGGSGSKTSKHRAETWLIQEFCDCGTLGGIASSWEMQHECDEQMLERLLLLRDTAAGLAALHAGSIVHGDLNARNVLVATDNEAKAGIRAKVADLGLSRCLQHHATHRTTNTCGTMSHTAPELLAQGRMSTAIDVYAFAIMMWELYHEGRPAFAKLMYAEFFHTVVLRNVRPCIPPGMPADYQLLMCQCWAAEPGQRPPIATVLECLDAMILQREAAVGSRRTSREGVDGAHAPAAAAAAAGAASGPSEADTLAALVALLQPQEAQMAAILQQQEVIAQRLSEDGKDPSSTRLSMISNSALFAAGSHAAAADDSTAAQQQLMHVGDPAPAGRNQSPPAGDAPAAAAATAAGAAGQHPTSTTSLALDPQSSGGPASRLWFV